MQFIIIKIGHIRKIMRYLFKKRKICVSIYSIVLPIFTDKYGRIDAYIDYFMA